MLTRNLTPFLFGARATSRKPPQNEMTCVVRAAFRLAKGELGPLEFIDQGALSADQIDGDDEELAGECVVPSDFADFKLSAEVLFTGSCHTPGGRPLAECPVRLSVGDWTKSLRVVGPREWGGLYGDALGSPGTFSEARLDWKNAFGGPGHEKNPVGTGLAGPAAPRVEYPDAPIRSRSHAHDPASLGPISPYWPVRAKCVGEDYGATWRKKRAPFFAADFDWRYFFSAPADQRLPGYLRGDEEVILQNLHASEPILSFTLPAIRIRVFVNDVSGRFREVPMSIDTLHVDGDAGKVFLTWRGLDAVAEDDLSDVRTVLVASEPLDAQESVDVHRAALEAFEKDPIGIEGEPMPSKDLFSGTPTADDVDPVSRYLAELGMPEADRAPIRKAIAEALEADAKRDKPELDLAALVAQMSAERTPSFTPVKPGVMPPQQLRSQMRELLEKIDGVRADLERKRAEIDAIPVGADAPPRIAELREKLALDTKTVEEASRFPHDPRLFQLDPSYSYPTPLSTDAPGPGRDLVEHDLRGRDLRGLDLRGANLMSADLGKADLRGAQLQGANLRYAILWKANVAGADLSGADLTLVNAIGLEATGATFTGATLEHACFEAATLDEAILDDVSAEYVGFAKASLARASLQRARLGRSELDDAALRGANLSDAVAEETLFARADLSGAELSRARLVGASFASARCDGARFVNAVLTRALFGKASIGDARFDGAALGAAYFEEVRGARASFARVVARRARFYRASLDHADFSEADLKDADFRKARLVRASFRGASLFEATLLDAAGDHVDFSGANLTRTVTRER